MPDRRFRDLFRPILHVARTAMGTQAIAARLTSIENKLGQHAASTPAQAPAPVDFNMLLHRSRGALLRTMPPGANRLLSAGCSGGWYFDWMEQCYGRVPEHIGIEYYSLRPASLPDNVTWIANTASDMSDVASHGIDLLFSGQNIEHLWPEEVAGFLVEAARVVRQGGHLVVDSPNRDITARYKWSHPEHTIELTVAEMSELLTLAGFEVTRSAGIWLCRDPRTGRLLPLDANTPDDWSTTERLVAGYALPEHSFIWWLEARRTTQEPRREELERRLQALFATAWPERLQRLNVPAGHSPEFREGVEWIRCAPGNEGAVLVGPGTPLRAGRYRCTFHFDPDPGAGAPYAVCTVVGGAEA
ncbi:MAG TPA: methyltransferase domain-containing protein, partial [Longimicrobium sp.]|nr:methyltransferase domain-containing protein [Longimicrobium sp.]